MIQMWELPAMAAAQAPVMLADLALSQASQLPQGNLGVSGVEAAALTVAQPPRRLRTP